MPESTEDLTESSFENIRMNGAQFHRVDLSDARFVLVDLTGATFRNTDLINVGVSGHIENLVINGVDVAPLIDAELDRRYPGRALMRPTDAEMFREAWRLLEDLWLRTIERAGRMPAALLHESVDGEWSFIETLRHLVFATDAWVRRAVLGDPSPWDRLDLPNDEMLDQLGIPIDRDIRPSLEEVLELRTDRMATMRQVLAGLTDESLGAMTEPVMAPGYPAAMSFPVAQCLQIVLNEEWEHRLYAERDLDALSPPSFIP